MAARTSVADTTNGDWMCEDPSCKNVNFARRKSCNLCGLSKPSSGGESSKDPSGPTIGKAAAEKSKGLFSADDWMCTRCANVNWARRSTCNMCGAPKVGSNEERSGLGGGFNDRGTVEYKRRDEESDDEFDDFGRRRKKSRTDQDEDDSTRRRSSSPDTTQDDDRNEPDDRRDNDDVDDDEDEEDDDDDVDLSKYKLDSDDDDDDD